MTTVATQADIAVTKSDSPDPVVAGTNITYTVTITNNGPSDAQGVSLTDAVPANTTFALEQQNTGPLFTCMNPSVGSTGNVSCAIATLAAGASATFEIVVNVNANTANGTTITNNAVGATTTTDPNSGNNTGTTTTMVNTSADLAVTKSDSPDPVVAGTNLTYTINFTNNGSSDAQTVTVTDATPANTTFVSAVVTTGTGWSVTNPTVGNTGNVVFSKGTVAAGETAVFTVVVNVNANVAGSSTIMNSATAASTTSDPNSGNNTSMTTTTVNTSADLVVTKSDSPDPVTAGGDLTYTITVTNNGPSDAQGLQLSDTLPANTTFVSFTVPMGWTRTDSVPVGGTGTVTASATTLAAGANSQLTLVVHVDPNTPHLTVINNSATATTTTTDPDGSNNTGMSMTTVSARPDLSVTKTDVNDPVMLGTQISYHIVVKNNGPSDATGVVVTDKMPSSSMFVSATPSVGSCAAPVNNNLTCTIGNMLNGATATLDIVVKSTGNPNTIFDTATVMGNEADPNTANNEASESTRVVGFRSFKFAPTSVTGGCDSSIGTLTFTSGAPAGLMINFTDGGSPAVDPIGSVTTTGGEISIPVTAMTQLVTADVVANITASAAGNSIVGRLKVTPVRIVSLTFDPNPVTGGQVTTGTVTLTCPAPKDVVVRLSFDKAVAKPDVTMFTIPLGQTMGTFTITTKHPVVSTVATITASANGGYVRSTVTVNP
jgi:uncharacterized repeat protein (TIGR01451 family)